jgi:hypothetical protein
MHQWRSKHDITTLFATREVDRKARIRSGGQFEIGHAGPDHLPQRLPVEARCKGHEGGHH